MTRIISAAIVTSMLCCAGIARADDGPLPDDLQTVYLLVRVRSRGTAYPIENAKVKRVGDQVFLVGAMSNIDGAPKWAIGQPQYISMRDISSIQVCVTIDRLKEAYREYNK